MTNCILTESVIDEMKEKMRNIYAELGKVEKSCTEKIEDVSQMNENTMLSHDQWNTITSLHQELLEKHYDFFVVSQDLAAIATIGNLAEKHNMPARMWSYGIYRYLELLRKHRAHSLDVQEHLLNFTRLSYLMVTLLLERISPFREIWTECLGDLARYRMAVEDTDGADQRTWAEVSRFWYNHATDQCPEAGRIQNHLAVISRPDTLQQFFYYTKALIIARPFSDAWASMKQLVHSIPGAPGDRNILVNSFMAAHGARILDLPVERFALRSRIFLTNLRQDVGRLGQEAQQGIFVTCCNIGAILQYGNKDGFIATEFNSTDNTTLGDAYALAKQWASKAHVDPNSHVSTDLSSQYAFSASSFAFHTLAIILNQPDDWNLQPAVHVSMAFLWCLTLHPAVIQRLERLVPWSILANYLNSLFQPNVNISTIKGKSFPRIDGTTPQQLPEDLLIRGHTWSRLYYPAMFFDATAMAEDRPLIEDPSTMLLRYSRWMKYDDILRFTPTRLAYEFAPISQSLDHLSGSLYSTPRLMD
ncbi:unnamed protein product [Penicillium palitans]